MSWLKEVNWENIQKGANSVTSAASAINAAADTLNKMKVTKQTVTTTDKTPMSGFENSGMLLLLGFLLFGKKLF